LNLSSKFLAYFVCFELLIATAKFLSLVEDLRFLLVSIAATTTIA